MHDTTRPAGSARPGFGGSVATRATLLHLGIETGGRAR
jgi:hypothetical protein